MEHKGWGSCFVYRCLLVAEQCVEHPTYTLSVYWQSAEHVPGYSADDIAFEVMSYTTGQSCPLLLKTALFLPFQCEFLFFLFYLLVLFVFVTCVRGCACHTASIWKLEDNFGVISFFLPFCGFRTSKVLHSKHFYPLSHLASLDASYSFV